MKKFILIPFFTIFYFENLLAETLSEALNQAYKNNPDPNKKWKGVSINWSDWVNILGSGSGLSF